MLRPKVHFAQVPLTVAKKVLADELRRKKALERAQLSRKKELRAVPVEENAARE
jgi:hypothetical protein